MAIRGVDEEQEKRSYGTVFLLGSALLVALSLWSFWDDNITRRAWKRSMAELRLEPARLKRLLDSSAPSADS